MRSFLVMGMFVASLAHAGWNEYTEVRDLKLDVDGLSALDIDAGAGSLEVKGVPGVRSITVTATIRVDDGDDDEARELVESGLTLTLDRQAGTAVLVSDFDDGVWDREPGVSVDIEVLLPADMPLRIDDSSGLIDIEDVIADILIEDGSGSIEARNVGALEVDDGSGSIDIFGAAGDVSITDGSGSISIRKVDGTVTIDDGSGSIRVSDVEKNLIIEDDGSGSLKYSDIRGLVEQDS